MQQHLVIQDQSTLEQHNFNIYIKMSSFIQVITGSLAGTTVTGAYGSIQALTDSQLTVTTPEGTVRMVLPKGNVFTDTGTWLVTNSITQITAWTNSNIVIQSA